MIKKHVSLLLAFVLVASAALAQQDSVRSRHHAPRTFFDIAVNGGKSTAGGAISWFALHDVGRKKRISLGYGIRFTYFRGEQLSYSTAPAKYTSPIQNPFTIFSPTLVENLDTLTTDVATSGILNAMICLEYALHTKVSFGFNIDAIGFSAGRQRSFIVKSTVYDGGQPAQPTGRPTHLNLLLTSDNDIGSLNSEFFVRYHLRPNLDIRAGFTFLFSEFRTDQLLSFDNGRISNDRYRYKASMLMLAVARRL